MENSGGIQASLAGRYASALFDLARETKSIETVEASLGRLESAMLQSADLKRLVGSPLIGRDTAEAAIMAVARELGLDSLTTKFLGVLARNRRLRQAVPMIAAFRTMAARHRGEISAVVTTAHALSDDQLALLRMKLKSRVGRDVSIVERLDSAILGGLVIKIGSQLIDGSIRTKLNTLAHAMKG